MDRREFVTSFAALGATAALPTAASAQTDGQATGNSGSSPSPSDALRLATLRKETTRQLTTFNLARKSKTIPVPRGKRVTVGLLYGLGNLTLMFAYGTGGKASVVTPMAGLYSAVTIPLAVLVLGERVTGREGLGMALALAAAAALSYEKPAVAAHLAFGK